MTHQLKQYFIITGNYWAFTITDGALRMLVILYFHGLGYSALDIALLFLFYEFFGVITNLVGGWLGAHLGLNQTMHIGLSLQIVALGMLTVDNSLLSVPYVMAAQALSGIAKDLNKMSAKSAIKFLMPEKKQHSKLYRWVAFLTGSKNSLKGAGFFIGAALLTAVGFQSAIMIMIVGLVIALISSFIFLRDQIGQAKSKPKFKDIFSKSHAINRLSAARLFLFGARDIWFVVALPVYFQQTLHWSNTQVGSFMALWIIIYGVVQSIAPLVTGQKVTGKSKKSPPSGQTAFLWVAPLVIIPMIIAWQLSNTNNSELVLVLGLIIFGVIFAINSSIHSFLILAYSREEGVSLDVGFYYMANAMGRLIGTLLSGLIFQWQGLEACLLFASVFLFIAAVTTRKLEA
ncbi:MAG: organoarsenical effux MFS transporter ArsJ [Gammaproteobacteria bacterium]|nr:organoarsenical effux MFS transporter ArsJ [Gammaproteobacteria bacterium]